MGSVTTTLSTIAFSVMLLLFTFTDISNTYGTSTYWLGVVLSIVLFAAASAKSIFSGDGFDKRIFRTLSLKLFFLGIVAFISWAVISGFIYKDSQYTAIKYALKYTAMSSIVMVFCFFNVKSEFLMKSMAKVFLIFLAIILIIFNVDVFSKMILISGDGRVGLSIAYPGVIYKLAMFLSLFLVLIYAEAKSKIYLMLCLFSGFIISVDGSRTALLWIIILPVLVALIARFYRFKSVKKMSLLLPLFVLFVGFLSGPITKDYIFTNLVSGSSFYLNDVDKGIDKEGDVDNKEAYKVLERYKDHDLTRLGMYKQGLEHVVDEFPFGGGLMSTSVELPNGDKMVVHNLYIQLLGDLGVIGFFSYFLIFTPVFISMYFLYLHRDSITDEEKVNTLAVISIIICYLFKSLFHPLSSDITDLGFVLVALAVLIKWNAKYDTSYS
ncbi:O-antigen ligase family protein [Photobacterium sanguinicancri]|uniref:O-antigen ligase family protein n=1 Tax=Photobacterium sanguinicancri TaxID=875932 RepID=UPI0021C48D73|nr:O-antigen ligase family protein [Photobacterium sanguinicancri]